MVEVPTFDPTSLLWGQNLVLGPSVDLQSVYCTLCRVVLVREMLWIFCISIIWRKEISFKSRLLFLTSLRYDSDITKTVHCTAHLQGPRASQFFYGPRFSQNIPNYDCCLMWHFRHSHHSVQMQHLTSIYCHLRANAWHVRNYIVVSSEAQFT